MHLIYQVLSYLVIGAAMPLLWIHPKLRDGIKRRFGLYGDVEGQPWPPKKKDGPRIWLHGASAGDLIAMMPVIQEIGRRAPEATLIVSAMTNSGFTIAKDRVLEHVDAITYVPYDLPGSCRRAMRRIEPDLLVLEYAEIWPNLIHAAKKQGAKVAMTNGRLSEALVRRYRWFHRLIGNQLQKIDLMLMREELEAERALQLGAPKERVKVTGNTKFDNLAKTADPERIGPLKEILQIGDEPILVAGSTHDGEEKDILKCFKGMRQVDDRVRLLWAPRYPSRAARIASIAKAEQLRVVLRSEAEADGEATKNADVILLDTMGELATAYGLATLVFVGGSFVQRGGQNILEPAGMGRPVLFGPHMMNFRDSVEVLLGRGAIQVQDPTQLEKVARELLSRPEEIERLGEMARKAVQKARGASARNAEALLELVR